MILFPQRRLRRTVRTLQREQEELIARRNAAFGRPGYNLRKAIRQRLQDINGIRWLLAGGVTAEPPFA